MMSYRLALRRRQGGFLTLIGLLMAIVIIGILMAMYGMPLGGGGAGGTGDSETIIGGTQDRARDAVCRNNLSQIRAAIGIYAGTNGNNPSSLDQLNLGIEMVCPVGEEPYDYAMSQGQVHCVHPGHESF
jgi:hypothetical protein